jgi:hypothetical protein
MRLNDIFEYGQAVPLHPGLAPALRALDVGPFFDDGRYRIRL